MVNRIGIYNSRICRLEIFAGRFRRIWLSVQGDFAFIPGQFINIKFATNIRRSYSVVGFDAEKRELELLIDVSPGGVASEFFISAELGTEVTFLGSLGEFVYKEKTVDAPVIFLATGTGIAPFLPMVRSNLQGRQVKLFWGVRYNNETFLKAELDEIVAENPSFTYEICISRPEGEITEFHGYVTKKLELEWESMENITNADFYICGAGPMLGDAYKLLIERGINTTNIYTEKFY